MSKQQKNSNLQIALQHAKRFLYSLTKLSLSSPELIKDESLQQTLNSISSYKNSK